MRLSRTGASKKPTSQSDALLKIRNSLNTTNNKIFKANAPNSKQKAASRLLAERRNPNMAGTMKDSTQNVRNEFVPNTGSLTPRKPKRVV